MIEIQTSFENLSYRESVPVRSTVIRENKFLKVMMLGEKYYFSVLPGFHNSTLEEIDFKLKYFFETNELDFNFIDFKKKFFNIVSLDDALNNLNGEMLFVIETLLLAIIKKTHQGLFPSTHIEINELYRPDNGPSFYQNSKCLKIKIAPSSVEKCIRLINELHRQNSTLKIRLDGNRKFELFELIAFENKLKKNISPFSFSLIDYVEEPFKNFSDTYLFLKRSELKIAMDESFLTLKSLSEKDFPEDIPVVIKPSLSGLSTIYNWMLIHSKKRIIISSSYEHPTVKIGLDFLAAQRSFEYHGLENFLL